jgi:NADH:ubiquinone oxidoreductase subunit H
VASSFLIQTGETPMAQRELVLGSLTFLVVIAAGFFSATWVDRHYAAEVAQTTGTACVGKDGSWKNWVWANVPALSPKCD